MEPPDDCRAACHKSWYSWSCAHYSLNFDWLIYQFIDWLIDMLVRWFNCYRIFGSQLYTAWVWGQWKSCRMEAAIEGLVRDGRITQKLTHAVILPLLPAPKTNASATFSIAVAFDIRELSVMHIRSLWADICSSGGGMGRKRFLQGWLGMGDGDEHLRRR